MSITGLFPIRKWEFTSASIIKALAEEERELLMSEAEYHEYNKGETIFRENTVAAGVYLIEHGKVKKFKVDRERGEQIIYVANQEELIGYHALITGGRYFDSAAALESSRLQFIPKKNFLLLLEQSLVFNRRILATLAYEFEVLANGLSILSQKTVRERLALQLIVMREKYKSDAAPGLPVEINLSRADLSNVVGTARENVVRLLSDFRQEGILETKGRRIIIRDVKKLIAIANYH